MPGFKKIIIWATKTQRASTFVTFADVSSHSFIQQIFTENLPWDGHQLTVNKVAKNRSALIQTMSSNLNDQENNESNVR